METLLQDLRYALRLLRRSPGFAAAAILTLALGMGANTVMFSVLDTVLLRPLPYPQPDRLVQVWETDSRLNFNRGPVSPYHFLEWRKASQTFAHIATYDFNSMVLTGQKTPRRLGALFVTAEFFDVLGVSPLKGRTFLPGEDEPDKSHVAVLSYGAWLRYFGGDPKIVGQAMTLDDQVYSVIGVMPADFAFPGTGTEVWCLPGFDRTAVNRLRSNFLFAIGRMKPGAHQDQVQAEMNAIAGALNQQNGSTSGVRLVGLLEETVGNVRRSLLVLWAGVIAVLLIACANVAGLLLARAVSRQKEIAVRSALGGSRARLIRQFLTESVLLAIMGGVLGVGIALAAGRFVIASSNGAVPRLHNLHLDGWVLGFSALACLITGLMFGLAPGLHALRMDLETSLKGGGWISSRPSERLRLRNLFVVLEVSLAMVLLICGGLLTKALWRLQRVDAGFQAEDVLSFRFSVPRGKLDARQKADLYQRIAERLAALPGVESAGATNDLPFAGSRTSKSFDVEGRPPDPAMALYSDYRIVSPDYLHTMRVRLLEGREFTLHDDQQGALVAVINQAFAKKFFPGEEPIGHRLKSNDKLYEIVGVVANVKHENLAAPGDPELYVPYLQAEPANWAFFVVRSHTEATALAASVRNAVKEIAPGEPVNRINTMSDLVSFWMSPHKFTSLLLSIFAGLALALASIGIYGVIAYSVAQRTHEIGIRMALGADKAAVLRLILRQSARIAVLGLASGTGAALLATRALSSLLFGVRADDPAIFLGVAASLLVVILAASYLPARKATRVDPLIALRYE
ncbi:MAG TPA: ABC transporter permease [Candidatus Angelobacter sp.]